MTFRKRFFLLTVLPIFVGCGRPMLCAEDALADGKTVRLLAFVERSTGGGVRHAAHGKTVHFYIGDVKICDKLTDDQGRATVTCELPMSDAKAFTVRTNYNGCELETTAMIHRWDPNRIAIAVDIDGTISKTDFETLLFEDQDNESRPVKGARMALNKIAEDYNILYVTARPRFLMQKTHSWLRENQFPDGPVIAASGYREWMSQTRYKTRALTEVRDGWPNLRIGIGDTSMDAKAYDASKMLCIILSSDPGKVVSQRSVVVKDWTGVADFFQKNHTLLSDPLKIVGAIDKKSLIKAVADQSIQR